ncbi:MAG: transposase [Cardiobacteriaceae bacterium]|nr:transposase [Cardiobacteriaceae bacterium]
MPRTMLNDELWAKLSAILRQNGLYAKKSTRFIIEGILYRMRTGCPWRDFPAIFGKYNTVYCAFNRWSAKGIPQLIQKELCKHADCEWVFMDGSYVKAHHRYFLSF